MDRGPLHGCNVRPWRVLVDVERVLNLVSRVGRCPGLPTGCGPRKNMVVQYWVETGSPCVVCGLCRSAGDPLHSKACKIVGLVSAIFDNSRLAAHLCCQLVKGFATL